MQEVIMSSITNWFFQLIDDINFLAKKAKSMEDFKDLGKVKAVPADDAIDWSHMDNILDARLVEPIAAQNCINVMSPYADQKFH